MKNVIFQSVIENLSINFFETSLLIYKVNQLAWLAFVSCEILHGRQVKSLRSNHLA
mgnify:FL=1